MPRNWKKCLHIFIKNKQFKKRQCVTLEEILNTDQAKQRGLGGGPVCFFERDAKPLDCSKVNFDEFWTYLNNIFWCHTLTHSTIFRRLPLVTLNLSLSLIMRKLVSHIPAMSTYEHSEALMMNSNSTNNT